MSDATSSIELLASGGTAASAYDALPFPKRRWKTRVLLPGVIVAAGLGLLAYSARATFQTASDVWVLPIVSKPVSTDKPSEIPSLSNATPTSQVTTLITQAPGWVEADPYPITVPALAEGVIEEVLMVEGQHVETGQIVVKMIDEDARLAANATAAELRVEQAELQSAKARLDYQKINYDRLLRLHESANAPDIEWANAKREYEEAKAQVSSSEAKVERHETMCDQANLTLSRMEIKSPVAGIVMTRLVEPGTRISMSNNNSGERMGAVARLYDPKKLQVRVDVPLVDAAKVQIGTRAEIVTDATSDQIFKGTVTRLVHEANIQRNTVQVKVAIENPSETLKPEMLTRVRFFTIEQGQSSAGDARSESSQATSSGQLWAPKVGLLNVKNGAADIWIVENDKTGSIAALREVKIMGPEKEGYCPVSGDIRAGARVIIDPPTTLKVGSRVTVKGEHTGSGGGT